MSHNKFHRMELGIFLAALIVLGFGLYFFGPSITGFVIRENGYEQKVNLVITSSGNYTLELEDIGELKSLKLDGRISTYGNARVYLESNGAKYLVFDSSRIGESKAAASSNESNLITGFALQDTDEDTNGKNTATSDKDKKVKNKKPKWNGTNEFTINGQTSINLSRYFTDEDGDSLTYSALSTDEFSISIINEIATITPTTKKGLNTTLDLTASDGVDSKTTTIKLSIEAVSEEVQEKENSPPYWSSDIESFVVNRTLEFNLSHYFSDDEDDELTYSSGLAPNITIAVSGEIIKLTAADGYSGSSAAAFIAFDGFEIASRTVSLIVPEVIDINETINKTIPTNETAITNETINQTPALNDTIPTNQTLNDTAITNGTKTIAINLSYNTGTIYDANDNGEESVNGVVDLTVVDTKLSWDADESKLCTRWEVYNADDSSLTAFCNGNSNCCAFIGLLPAKSNWSGIYYSTYGKDNAGNDNIVSAQVIYYDVNVSAEYPNSDIYYSSWGNLSITFYEDEVEFNDECLETCPLSGINKSSITLIFEIENDAVLRINTVKYSILKDVSNSPPVLSRNFSTINISRNKNYTINLSEYFKDPDGDRLNYDYYPANNISIVFDNNLMTIMPDKGFSGARYTFISANDSDLSAVSNMFMINVSSAPESIAIGASAAGSFILQSPVGEAIATIDSSGDMQIAGTLTQNTEPSADSNDFIIQNSTGGLNLAVSNPEGNLMIKNTLNENQQTLIPTPESFVIENNTGAALAYVNSTGGLFILGNLTEFVKFS